MSDPTPVTETENRPFISDATIAEVERVSEGYTEFREGACPFTHAHTRRWCGYAECRES
jgi:hypothetical protein